MAAAGVLLLRSSVRRPSLASRFSATIKSPPSPFRSHKPLSPPSHRCIFRSPVEMSCVTVESFFPFHTATSSALLTSLLLTAPSSTSASWLIDDS